jgi:hypothetical protein
VAKQGRIAAEIAGIALASEIIDGPDFICIGMQKAGTGSLFDQVQYHPDFWMPPEKVHNYLLENPSQLRNVQQRLAIGTLKP